MKVTVKSAISGKESESKQAGSAAKPVMKESHNLSNVTEHAYEDSFVKDERPKQRPIVPAIWKTEQTPIKEASAMSK
jgi:hypothetical protein